MTASGPGGWRGAALAAVLLAASACHREPLKPTESSVRLTPAHLLFVKAWAGGNARTATVTAENDGKVTLAVTWHLPEAPFTLVDPPAALRPGSTALEVRFAPAVAGHFSSVLSFEVAGVGTGQTALEGVAEPAPACPPSSSCAEASFDLATEACVEVSKPDGTACDPGTVCVTAATCQAGRCIGPEVSCDDHDACTVDVCNATLGCEHLPAPPCPGDGRCQLGVCDRVKGCGLTAAPDGTTCGTDQSCTAAQVCISGDCVTRRPPDGYLCAEASPCQGEGHCLNDVCVRAGPAVQLRPSWSFDSHQFANPDAGVPAAQYHDFVLEGSGAATLGGFFFSPMMLRANTPSPTVAPLGVSRRCILWNGTLVCADYPSSPNGKVSALDLATGARLWTYEIQANHPDFARLTTAIFMARLVVQGGDRLTALFEAYPAGTGTSSPTLCRNYFLVVLDASGREVTAQQVHDPLLDACNHPHPYGVVADAVGNLFIAFSPTTSQAAPLKPDKPTLLMSFTHDGVFRWKLTDTTMSGGELAVARGLLYSENASQVVMAATGATAFVLPQTLGRVVISDTRLIPAPVEGAQQLTVYEAGTNQPRWTHKLKPTASFFSDQLRLASWDTSRGKKTVALTWVADGATQLVPTLSLLGINVHDGSEAFSCPVAYSAATPPQLFELAEGSLTVMGGALDVGGNRGCGKCDPPFAGSSARFITLPTAGLGVPKEPWLGTFGGPTHDHQEEVFAP